MRKFSFFTALTAMIITISLVVLPMNSVFAEIADGSYNVNFELKEAGNNNTSIADGYFSKPAKLTVENGVNYVQLTITNSEWVKSLSGPHGAASVVSEDKGSDVRTVKMQVGNLSQPVTMQMHVVVPKDIAGMDYDHNHTVRGVFDVSGLPKNGGESVKSEDNSDKVNSNDESSGTGKAEDNPPTGDNSSIGLYVMLLLGSLVGIFTVWKLRPARD